jgi:hypothetical protein
MAQQFVVAGIHQAGKELPELRQRDARLGFIQQCRRDMTLPQ